MYRISYTERLLPSPDGFTPHVLKARWTLDYGWEPAYVVPMLNITLHPAAKVLTRGQQVFDAITANKGFDGEIRMFRPEVHIQRFKDSANRLILPDIEENELLYCLKQLVKADSEYIPAAYSNGSLQVRPVLVGTDEDDSISQTKEAILYVYLKVFKGTDKRDISVPRDVMSDPEYSRVWPGGLGQHLTSANYAGLLMVARLSKSLGFQDFLWLHGTEELLTELNEGNIFIFMINDRGSRELVTPPLNGLIVPGVTRQSILELAKHWVCKNKIMLSTLFRL